VEAVSNKAYWMDMLSSQVGIGWRTLRKKNQWCIDEKKGRAPSIKGIQEFKDSNLQKKQKEKKMK